MRRCEKLIDGSLSVRAHVRSSANRSCSDPGDKLVEAVASILLMKSLMPEFVTVGIAVSSLFFAECDARAQELALDQLIQHQ